MQTRSFGADGHPVSEIGLGAWQLGGSWGDVVPEGDAFLILSSAIDAGVNYIDTADVYGQGRSERIIGQFLKDCEPRPFVATKLGRSPQPGWPENFSRDTMCRHTEASLKRLDVHVLDLTQLHCLPTDELRRGQVFDHLREMRDEGMILRFGASVETMEQAQLCLAQEGLASLQIIFNVFRQAPIRELFDSARERGVALIVRLPLASGLLTGKIREDTEFPDNDHRHFNAEGQAFHIGETFAGLTQQEGVRLARRYVELLPEDFSPAQAALRFILDHEAVTTVIPGATRADQARANAAASDLPPLGEDVHARLAGFYEEEVRPHIRGQE